MNPVSIIILLLIIAYCAFIIYKQVQKKKQGDVEVTVQDAQDAAVFRQMIHQQRKKKGNK